MSELPEVEIVQIYAIHRIDGKLLSKSHAEEIVHRCDCHDELVASIKKAHKEGYVEGYGAGVDTDGCVESRIIDQDEWAKCWNESKAKAALAKARKE